MQGYAEPALGEPGKRNRKGKGAGKERSDAYGSKRSFKKSKKEIAAQAMMLAREFEADARAAAKGDAHVAPMAKDTYSPSPQNGWVADDAAEAAGLVDLPMPDLTALASVVEDRRCSAPQTASRMPRSVLAQPFEFEDDARAERVENKVVHAGLADTVSKVINWNDRILKTHAFSLGFMFNRHGNGALSGPFAQSFFSKPGVARAFAESWLEFCQSAPCVEQEGRRFALKEFSEAGGYGPTWEAIKQAFVELGMEPPELLWNLPVVTAGPPKMSARVASSGVLMERVATLEMKLPIPADSPLASVPPPKEEIKDIASATVDRSYPFSRSNYRRNRLGVFEGSIRASNQTAAENAAARSQQNLARQADEFISAFFSLDGETRAGDSLTETRAVGYDTTRVETSPGGASEGAPLVLSANTPDTAAERYKNAFIALRGSSNNTCLLSCSAIRTEEKLAISFTHAVLCN